MKNCHHLEESTILRYASGDLDHAFSVVVASHVAMCDQCREAVRIAEEIGGHVLDEIESAEMYAGAFERLMDKLCDAPKGEQDAARMIKQKPRDLDSVVPMPLRRFIGSSLDDVAWKRVAPGVLKHDILAADETSSPLYMLKIAAGKTVPEHGHGGAEMTLILSGAYRDDLGRFAAGDIADLDENLEHQPKVEPDAPCICLVATEGPTLFKGFFSRLLQPLVGI